MRLPVPNDPRAVVPNRIAAVRTQPEWKNPESFPWVARRVDHRVGDTRGATRGEKQQGLSSTPLEPSQVQFAQSVARISKEPPLHLSHGPRLPKPVNNGP